jgi:hypothetical protein
MRSIRPLREVSPDASRPWLRSALPLAGLLSLGLAALSISTPGQELGAGVHVGDDADGDGLSDAQEGVEQTSPFSADTDGDGFADVEELARGSDPRAVSDTPLPGATALSLTARGEEGRVHIVLMAYYADGRLSDKLFNFGVVIRDGTVVSISPQHVLANASFGVYPTIQGSGEVAVVEFDLSPGPIHLLEQVSLFATMSVAGSGIVNAAAVVNLFSSQGVLLKSGPIHATHSSNRSQSTGGGVVYQPIPPSDELPMGWQPGRICHQKTTPVGYESGVVLTRVVSAECEDGWDSHCSPVECKASIGDEYSTVDPVGLVGG